MEELHNIAALYKSQPEYFTPELVIQKIRKL